MCIRDSIHDEGPDKDKGYGPYVQSERQASGLYLKYAHVLLVGGRAYLPAEDFVLAEFFDRYVKMAFIDYSAIKLSLIHI